MLNDMKTEVLRASNAGLDGFAVDILSISGYNWDRFKVLLEAAPQTDPNFRIMIMPDSNGSGCEGGSGCVCSRNRRYRNDSAYNKSLFRLKDGRPRYLSVLPREAGCCLVAGLASYHEEPVRH
jgi:hypothetical protein